MREKLRILLLLSCGVLIILLAGCACEHEWTEATYTEPKTCTKCGETEGEPLPVIGLVKESYQDALDLAKLSGQNQDYEYGLLHMQMSIRQLELKQGHYDEEAVKEIVRNCASQEDALSKLTDMLTYVVDTDGDEMSALMQKFATLDSVTGTIETTKVDIVVEDANQLLDELSMQPEAFGKVLAMLDMYDYTNLFDGATEADKLLQFTERGFTYSIEFSPNWAFGDGVGYVLSLGYTADPLTKEDFVITGDVKEEYDMLKNLESGWYQPLVPNVEPGETEKMWDTISFARGLTLSDEDRSSLDEVLSQYGQTKIQRLNTSSQLYQDMFGPGKPEDQEYSDKFLQENQFYVQYECKNVAYLYFCFNKNCEVSWIIAYAI